MKKKPVKIVAVRRSTLERWWNKHVANTIPKTTAKASYSLRILLEELDLS